ncbi:MAG: TrlF family AAA-like ATPase [Patescibacteria group bacterium]
MPINNKSNNLYARGSKWRKWDLQVHTPGTKLNDGYKVDSGKDVWDEFCEKIEQSDVEAFGITDYFSADGYRKFIDEYQKKYQDSKKKFFLNIELRLNESVNRKLEEVNIHLIFNPASLDKIDSFLRNLKIVKTGKDEKPIKCSQLKKKEDYESATITREGINKAFEDTFGKKAIRQDHFLIFAAVGGDGIRAERGKKRKEIISDEIDKFSDGFFGSIKNQKYFLDTNRLEDKKLKIGKKPVVAGSDAHSFEDLNKFLGKRVVEIDKNDKEIIVKDVTWIKADPTYEGLKQILYEPEPSERVWIGPAEPDKKNEYQVIRKIKFHNTNDFPDEIVFNKNLCSIIGSRSSGKSALLAYIAHSIDKDLTERLIDGPGEGEEYRWDKIKIGHLIEWDNGLFNDESPGKIVYIRQNYLFEKSKDSEEIKKKIEPVLFKCFPDFEIRYKQAKSQIDAYNKQVSEQVENWFESSDLIVSLEEGLRNLGNKEIIEKEKQKVESKIETVKRKYQLSEEDVKRYQEISAKISEYEIKIKQIKKELSQIAHVSEESYYFSALNWNLIPNLENLPKKLQEAIIKDLQESRDNLLERTNRQVIEYKKSIEKEQKDFEEKITKTKEDHKDLLEKYQKNIELEELIKKLNEYKETIKKIDDTEKEERNAQEKLEGYEKSIEAEIKKRQSILVQLKNYLGATDLSIVKDIRFGIEYGLNRNDIEKVAKKVNLRDKTDFVGKNVEKNELNIELIRKQPAKFLQAIYSGKQKINVGNEKKEVVNEILILTENILFNAEMEGDRIGGFSETTMTPGRRALFLLKLILAESKDTWPILIDQPEDNLDSRSITNEIVPFLKKKKKERQIIMVSHNANLVIGADSEQIIVANRHGSDRQNEDGKQFNYLTGSIEHTKEKDKHCKDTLKAQGVREHALDILDGGKAAFEHRRNKYNLTKI